MKIILQFHPEYHKQTLGRQAGKLHRLKAKCCHLLPCLFSERFPFLLLLYLWLSRGRNNQSKVLSFLRTINNTRGKADPHTGTSALLQICLSKILLEPEV